MVKTAKRKAGRPKLAPGEAYITVSLRLTGDMMEWMDDQRESRLDRPNRSTIAREIFAEAMSRDYE